jgi:hypothetical protein
MDSLITGDATVAWPHELENPNCSLHAFSRGLFYSVEGTGETMAITLTTDIPEDRTLEVAILTSEECNECVMYSDFLTAEDTPHTLELATEKSKNYTVVVSGEGFADVGVFQLEMEGIVSLDIQVGYSRYSSTSIEKCTLIIFSSGFYLLLI